MDYRAQPLDTVLQIEQLYTAFVGAYEPDFHFPGESHRMWEIDCILAGTASITSGTEVYSGTAGEVVIHPPGVFHNVRNDGDCALRIMTFSFSGEGLLEAVPSGKFILNHQEQALTERLLEELERDREGEHRDAAGLQILKSLLELFCLTISRRKRETAAPSRDRDARLFAEIVTFLQENVDAALTSYAICNACGVGETVVKELFRSLTGGGLMKYYNRLRTKRAAELIGEGLSMAEIAERMHFSSQNYFSAFFRKQTGIPPSRYRDQAEQNMQYNPTTNAMRFMI